jgi:hypothetical protein
MKKALLILGVLLTTVSGSFADSVYFSASGFYQGSPSETGTYRSVTINDWYAHNITVSGGVSNEDYTAAYFCYADFGCDNGTYNYQYGDGPNPTTAKSFNYSLGTVYGSYYGSYVYGNLEVFALDAWAQINY